MDRYKLVHGVTIMLGARKCSSKRTFMYFSIVTVTTRTELRHIENIVIQHYLLSKQQNWRHFYVIKNALKLSYARSWIFKTPLNILRFVKRGDRKEDRERNGERRRGSQTKFVQGFPSTVWRHWAYRLSHRWYIFTCFLLLSYCFTIAYYYNFMLSYMSIQWIMDYRHTPCFELTLKPEGLSVMDVFG